MTQTHLEHADELRGIAMVYRLLGRFFSSELDEATWSLLLEPPTFEVLRELGIQPPERLAGSSVEEQLEDLAIDFCQLFVGPKDHLIPVHSVWSEGRYDASAAQSLSQFLAAIGVRDPRQDSAMPVDHLGNQLTLMSQLLERQAEGINGEDNETPWDQIAQQFSERFLRWPGPLLKQMESKAESEFYQSLAGVTYRFLEAEADEA